MSIGTRDAVGMGMNLSRPVLPIAMFVVAVAPRVSADADCLTSNNQTSCGFSCLAAYGVVRCAQTPDGICEAGGASVTCWDPPPYVRRHYGVALPRPECTHDYGLVACGYHCASGYGKVRCADTPAGSCESAYGQVVCGDPRPEEFRRREAIPQAECAHAYNRVACGYSCIDGYGDVQCAKSPDGICRVVDQSLRCFDPVPPPPP
jgi:hypothetical protein